MAEIIYNKPEDVEFIEDPVKVEDPLPNEDDFEESKKIERLLDVDFAQYESRPDFEKKKKILATLSDIVIRWVQQCSDEDNKDSGGAIFPFGSFKLGVNGPNSDIDILCVAPKHI